MINQLFNKKIRLLFAPLFLLMFSYSASVNAQAPVASFIADVTAGCAPLSVNFTNTSTGANSYNWSFGNSSTSNVFNPSTLYLSPGTYTVTLTVTNTSNGQQSTATKVITVVNNPIANFTISATSGCEDYNNICFTNTSQFAATYVWDFGDGNTSSLVNPCHTYNSSGVYTVKLIAVSVYGCSNLIIKNNIITINPKPVANFSSNIQSSCNVSDLFTFTANAPGANAWNWNFGDLSTSVVQNPSHTYASSGTYSVQLIATNSFGCTDTVVKINYINIGAALVPSFTLSDSGGCAPFTVNFNCTVANVTSWSWNLGNGTTSTLQNPSATYNTSGNYPITLAVTTQSGCNGSVTIPGLVVVDALPIPSFTVTQDTGCSPFTPTINNTSTGAASYQWSTNPLPQTSTQTNPVFTYSNAGPYNLTLIAYSPNGCPKSTTVNNAIQVLDPTAVFTGAPLVGCVGMMTNFTYGGNPSTIGSYLWSFGDGTFSGLQNPSHAYTSVGNYTVWLIVTNTFGCKDTVYKASYVKIYPSPIPYATDTLKVCQGIAQSFTDPTQGSNTWLWNFGDGTTSIIRNPNHTYSVIGTYTVTLNTTMAGGCTQNFNPFHIVQVIPYVPKPVVINYISKCKPYTIGFSNAGAVITGYLWDFGDSSTSTLPAPVHNYSNAGTYTVKLFLTVGAGCQDVITNTIVVGNVNPMKVDSMNICFGVPSQFTLLNSAAFTNYNWNFGDGTNSILQNPSHTYTAGGSYTVKLMTTDTSGCKDTFLLGPIVVNRPIAAFSIVGPSTGCNSLAVQFQNNSTGAATYFWLFGDSKTDTQFNTSHTYFAWSPFYTVTLISSINGCSDTLVKTNAIHIVVPVCNFSFSNTDLCIPITTNFTDLSPAAISWLWDFGDGTSSTVKNPTHTFNSAPSGPIVLTIVDSNGCTATLSKSNITYYNASATVTNALGCAPLISSFTDSSTSSTAWQWFFGDGGSSSQYNPTHTYLIDGTYNVTLIATFPGGCIDTTIFSAMVVVNTPSADFVAPAASGCSPVTISFSNLSTDAVSFLWDFGDGSTSTSINPTHIYNIPGFYDVTLIAYGGQSCADTMIKQSYIAVPGVYSTFNISSSTGCDTLPAFFLDSSINAIDWLWTFGDGITSTVKNPTHTYLDTGSYVVTLITHDTLGCTSVYTYPIPIKISQSPTADATTTDTAGCTAYMVAFNNMSLNATSYLWQFGNGDTSTSANPSYTYAIAGVYQPYLVAATAAGCRDTSWLPLVNVKQMPVAQFSTSADTACEPATISFTGLSSMIVSPSYSWNLGNGNNSTLQNPTNIYTANSYTVSLTVTNSNGCVDSFTRQLFIRASPVASASTTDIEGCQPYSVQFLNGSTGANQYLWQLESGIGNTAVTPNYIYSQPGSYYPSLIATNTFGCTDTFLFSNPIVVHAVPVPVFTPSATTVCNPDSITYSSSSTNLENPVYNWNYGNGLSGNTIPGGMMYTDSGIYNVTLYIVNTFGCNDSVSQTVTVNASPILTATTADTLGCSPLTVLFNNTSQFANSYIWDFGDTSSSSAVQPSHTYLNGGLFQPVLIASNNYGCSDTMVLQNSIQVNQTPKAALAVNDSNSCFGSTVTFINNCINTISPVYLWDVGFTTTVATNPSFIYPAPGIYNVSLLVTNNNGCADSLFAPALVEVYDTLPPPQSVILSVSVVNDNAVDITWQNNPAADLASYLIYRLAPATGIYNLIHTENNPVSLTTAPSTTYRDTLLDTRDSSYTYKIVTTDQCGYAEPINNSNPHTTINVTAVQAGTNINVSWTPYGGCPVSSYNITRIEVSSGLQQLIANVDSVTYSYLDTSLSCPFPYAYLITANDICGNAYISLSDTSVAIPLNILAGQLVDVVRSTVVNNSEVLTEWLPPVLLPGRVASYQILRSTNNINFVPIASVPAMATSYIDLDVNVKATNYYYRIAVINDCNLSGPQGEEGSSIFLNGEWNNYKTKLHWTKYLLWNNGVDHYTLEKLNDNGVWEFYLDADGNTTDVELNE